MKHTKIQSLVWLCLVSLCVSIGCPQAGEQTPQVVRLGPHERFRGTEKVGNRDVVVIEEIPYSWQNGFGFLTRGYAYILGAGVLSFVALAVQKPIEEAGVRFVRGYLYPKIDIWANKVMPSRLWEMGSSSLNHTHARVNDLIMNDDVYVKINTYLFALKSAVSTNSPMPTLLLYGPSGTGKTEIAKRLVNEGPFLFKSYSGTELANKAPQEIKHLFDTANKEHRDPRTGKILRAIIFIDEVESFLKGSAFGVRGGVWTEFLKANGTQSPYYTFVVATNFIEKIDRAAFRRFNNPIHVTLPEPGKRQLIYKTYMQQMMKAPMYKSMKFEHHWNTDGVFWNTLDSFAEGLSGSDLKYIVQNNFSEAAVRNQFVVTKETVKRHMDDKRKEYQVLQDKFDAAENRYKRELQQQIMARKLAQMEDEDDEEEAVIKK